LTAQAPKDFGLMPTPITAEEEDAAALGRLRLVQQENMHHPSSDGFALQGALQFLAMRLVVEDTQVEGLVSGVECARGPVHKLGEVEEKCSLDFVLVHCRLSTCGLWRL
jgi:hypothetical protein